MGRTRMVSGFWSACAIVTSALLRDFHSIWGRDLHREEQRSLTGRRTTTQSAPLICAFTVTVLFGLLLATDAWAVCDSRSGYDPHANFSPVAPNSVFTLGNH